MQWVWLLHRNIRNILEHTTETEQGLNVFESWKLLGGIYYSGTELRVAKVDSLESHHCYKYHTMDSAGQWKKQATVPIPPNIIFITGGRYRQNDSDGKRNVYGREEDREGGVCLWERCWVLGQSSNHLLHLIEPQSDRVQDWVTAGDCACLTSLTGTYSLLHYRPNYPEPFLVLGLKNYAFL